MKLKELDFPYALLKVISKLRKRTLVMNKNSKKKQGQDLQTNKRICCVIPSLHAGGMERVMSELATYFALTKHAEVYLIILGESDKFYNLPVEVKIYEPDLVFQIKSRLIYAIKIQNFVRKSVKTINPHVVLSFGETYNSFVILSLLFTKNRIFVSDRSRPDRDWGFLQNQLRRILYPFAEGIIAQTRIAKELALTHHYNKNISVIGNPIKEFNNILFTKRENIILTAGRMIKSKRFDFLLSIFSKSDYKNRNWKLMIVGDGPECNNLIALSKSLRINQNVIFTGNKTDIERYYFKAKIFAYTSNSEGFPNVLGEAMMSGLAPITYRFIAGSEDLICHNENGYIIEMDDESSYINHLNLLMNNPILIQRFAKNAQASIQEFSLQKIGDEYYKFLFR